jgi:serine/threonine-protein kinase PRP4
MRATQTEKVILRKLAGADPEGKRHCIKMLRSFEYRNHLCLVFEPMVRAGGWHRNQRDR